MENTFIRGYYQLNKSHYAKADHGIETMIGLYATDGGCSFEFSIKWIVIGNALTGQVRVYEDSFKAFKIFPELFDGLAKLDRKNPDQAGIAAFLNELGFKDLTKYKDDGAKADLTDEEQLLKAAANRVEMTGDKAFLAYWIFKYQQDYEKEDHAMSALLGCSLRGFYLLQLCKTPGQVALGKEYFEALEKICNLCGCKKLTLDNILDSCFSNPKY